jgi:hypothetical protein
VVDVRRVMVGVDIVGRLGDASAMRCLSYRAPPVPT